MTRKQIAMLAQVIKREIRWQQYARNQRVEYPGPHFMEVGLERGSIKTARSLVRTGLLEWEGSDNEKQIFVKLNRSLAEGD